MTVAVAIGHILDLTCICFYAEMSDEWTNFLTLSLCENILAVSGVCCFLDWNTVALAIGYIRKSSAK